MMPRTPKGPKEPPIVLGKNCCIFCNRIEKLTKEHVWPRWVRDYIKIEDQMKTVHLTMHNGGKPQKGKFTRPGDIHSQRIHCVCGSRGDPFKTDRCNNVWMSQLQERAKTILIPLITGTWKSLDGHEQSIVSAWAQMFTMVNEFTDSLTQVIPQSYRTTLMNDQKEGGNRTPLPDWYVWIGAYDDERVAGANHHAMTVSIPSPPGLAITHHLQTTGFTVGKLLVFTALFPIIQGRRVAYEAVEGEYDLRTISPFKGPTGDTNPQPHTFASFAALTNRWAEGNNLPTFTFP